jgi:UPF0716 family protein affecting phage T7 exclusion
MNLPWTSEQILMGIAVFVVSTVVTTAIVAAFVVWIAEDHFVAKRTGVRRKLASPIARGLWLVAKNLLGVVLVVAGVVLALPGVPGQGLLTIFVGILLLDIPGKRKFELAIVRRPAIRNSIDRLRARFDRPPLQIEPPSDRQPGASL